MCRRISCGQSQPRVGNPTIKKSRYKMQYRALSNKDTCLRSSLMDAVKCSQRLLAGFIPGESRPRYSIMALSRSTQKFFDALDVEDCQFCTTMAMATFKRTNTARIENMTSSQLMDSSGRPTSVLNTKVIDPVNVMCSESISIVVLWRLTKKKNAKATIARPATMKNGRRLQKL